MAKRNLSNSNAFAGAFATAADLPNVAGSATQYAAPTKLEAGDHAYVTASKTMWQCVTPTLGAAVWTPVGAGTNLGNSRLVTINNDTLLVTDVFVHYTFAGAVPVVLPNFSASLPANQDFFMLLQQENVLTQVTVTPAAGLIDGIATLVLPVGIASAPLRSRDGLNWFSQ